MRPVRGRRLLIAKAFVAGVLIWAATILVTVAALVAGIVLFGAHPWGPQFPGPRRLRPQRGAWPLRVVIAAAYVAFGSRRCWRSAPFLDAHRHGGQRHRRHGRRLHRVGDPRRHHTARPGALCVPDPLLRRLGNDVHGEHLLARDDRRHRRTGRLSRRRRRRRCRVVQAARTFAPDHRADDLRASRRRAVADIREGRWTAEIEGDFVVFIIGARLNSKWQRSGVDRPRRPAGHEPHAQVPQRPTGEGPAGLPDAGFTIIQYWRSFEHLEAFARDTDDPHLDVWRRYWKRVGNSGRTGIWHETFLVRDGQYEAIYGNVPPRRPWARPPGWCRLAESVRWHGQRIESSDRPDRAGLDRSVTSSGAPPILRPPRPARRTPAGDDEDDRRSSGADSSQGRSRTDRATMSMSPFETQDRTMVPEHVQLVGQRAFVMRPYLTKDWSCSPHVQTTPDCGRPRSSATPTSTSNLTPAPRPRPRSGRHRGAPAASSPPWIAGGHCGGALAGRNRGLRRPQATNGSFNTAAVASCRHATPAKQDVSALISSALPGVVSISVELNGGQGAGTGFVISSDGEIATNAHVVADASRSTSSSPMAPRRRPGSGCRPHRRPRRHQGRQARSDVACHSASRRTFDRRAGGRHRQRPGSHRWPHSNRGDRLGARPHHRHQ